MDEVTCDEPVQSARRFVGLRCGMAGAKAVYVASCICALTPPRSVLRPGFPTRGLVRRRRKRPRSCYFEGVNAPRELLSAFASDAREQRAACKIATAALNIGRFGRRLAPAAQYGLRPRNDSPVRHDVMLAALLAETDSRQSGTHRAVESFDPNHPRRSTWIRPCCSRRLTW